MVTWKQLPWATLFIWLAIMSTARAQSCDAITDCNDCTNPDPQCVECVDGYALKTDSTGCLECPDNCGGCTATEAGHADCDECDVQYYLNDDIECTQCVSHCDECTGDNQCSTCEDRYRLAGTGITCESCSSHCAECTDSSECRVCDAGSGSSPGYYVNSAGGCSQCSSGCSICEDSSSCDTCLSGYTYDTDADDGSCETCIDNCAECTTTGGCQSCDDGYSLSSDSTVCLSCDNCESGSCPSSGGCSNCVAGYIETASTNAECLACPTLNDNEPLCNTCSSETQARHYESSECKYCPSNCVDCSISGTTGCDQCVPGQYWDGSECTDCFEDCITCASTSSCSECDSGLYYHSTSPVSCEPCSDVLDHCQECNHAGTTCSVCDTGYYVDSSSTCSACSDDPNAEQCAACEGSTSLGSAYTPACIDCGANCAPGGCELDPDDAESIICTECNDGYYADSLGTCIDCTTAFDSNCLTCSSSTCLTCATTFYVGGAGTCITCSGKDGSDTCNACTSSTCTTCSTAAFGPDGSGNCESCSGYDGDDGATTPTANPGGTCESCTDTSGCTQCADTYSPDSSGNCAPCTGFDGSDTCNACSTSKCTTCATAGFGPDGSGNCESCTGYDGDDGATTPTANPAGTCESCTDASGCTQCADTYSPDSSGNCAPCAAYDDPSTAGSCLACLFTTSKCTTCDSGFALGTDGICFDCGLYDGDDTCSECDTETCSTCASASMYFNEDGNCTACPVSGFDELSCDACNANTHYFRSICTECPDNCELCVDANPSDTAAIDMTCTQCASGYYLDDNACELVNCNDGYANADECSICAEEEGLAYDWTTSTCAFCPEFCNSCDSDGDCTDCMTSYVIDDSTGGCVSCVFDEDTCVACGTADTQFFYWVSTETQCLGCLTNCAECSSTATCDACDSGYHLDSSDPAAHACDSCLSGCVSCDDGTTCNECDVEKYLLNSATPHSCPSCVSNCLECSDDTSCTLCYSGMYWLEDACTSCPDHCSDCDTDDGCQACSAGYHLDDNSVCQDCTDDLDDCAECASAEECTLCDSGFFLNNGVCTVCMDNCIECEDGESCDTCSSTSCWDESAGACQSMSGDNCYTCLEDGTTLECQSCVSGHYLTLCQECSDNCISCDADAEVCTQCATGFYLEDDECSECSDAITNCLICDSATSCTCPNGYFFNQEDEDNLECTECSSVIPNCYNCTSATSCTNCYSGYVATTDSNGDPTCASCPINCAKCPGGTETCSVCDEEDMFFDEESERCTNCATGCETCASLTACGECAEKYVLVNSTSEMICVLCTKSNCAACEVAADGTASICTECIDGYFMNSESECASCSSTFPNCGECADANADDSIGTGECEECSGAYLFNEDQSACIQCTISRCGECIDHPNVCSDCAAPTVATEEAYACYAPCYVCSGPESECPEEIDGNYTDVESVACPGYCSVNRTEYENGTVIYQRGCQERTCDEDGQEESCMTTNTVQTCSKCCLTANCNIYQLDGVAEIAASVVVLVISLVVSLLSA